MDCREMILSEDTYDIITDFSASEFLQYETNCYESIGEEFLILYLNSPGIRSPEIDFFPYHNMPKLYGLMQLMPSDADASDIFAPNTFTPDTSASQSPASDISAPGTAPFDPSSLIASGITQMQRPPLSLTGQGVILCFLDTGIDYRDPAFLDENGSSRILALWDQTIQTGTPPEGLKYGSEYRREDINRALRAEDPYEIVPSRDLNGHGSVLAGIAAGNVISSGTPYIGAAPNADIVVVKLKECKQYLRRFYLVPDDVPAYQENDIMLGIKYAESFVRLFERPVVICLGLGTNQGDHAGNSALSRYLSLYAVRRSRAAVVCGGNEGNASHHYHGRLDGQTAEGNARDVEVRVSDGSLGFWLELWGNLPDAFNLSIRTPGGEDVPRLRLGLQQSVTYSFIYEKSRVTIDSALVEENSGEELILVRVQDPTPGIWTFRVSASGSLNNGHFHMWLPITEFLNAPVYFLNPDPDMTLTEPSMAPEVMSVSTYNAENNSFYPESGRGFGRTGQIRPDLAAPGVNVSTIRGKRTGSSLAAAITAGAVAQFFQWAVIEGNNRLAESREIRSYFIRGAVRTPGLSYPNREWGYGRLNLEETFHALLR